MKLKNPLRVLRFYLADMTGDEKYDGQIRLLRVMMLIGFVFVFLNFGTVLEDTFLDKFPQSLDEADVSTGTITDVAYRRKGPELITLRKEGIEKSFIVNGFSKVELKRLQGKEVTIWSCESLYMYSLQNDVLEIEVNGQKVLNNYDIYRLNRNASEPGFWTLLGLAVFILPLLPIRRLLIQKK